MKAEYEDHEIISLNEDSIETIDAKESDFSNSLNTSTTPRTGTKTSKLIKNQSLNMSFNLTLISIRYIIIDLPYNSSINNRPDMTTWYC